MSDNDTMNGPPRNDAQRGPVYRKHLKRLRQLIRKMGASEIVKETIRSPELLHAYGDRRRGRDGNGNRWVSLSGRSNP